MVLLFLKLFDIWLRYDAQLCIMYNNGHTIFFELIDSLHIFISIWLQNKSMDYISVR
jgi:hypothetical protein